MNGFFGDQPIKVVIKLILLSLLVGFILKVLNITPIGLFEWLIENIAYIINVSFNSIEKVMGYIITGAVVVIPIWIFKRIGEKKRDEKIKSKFDNQ